MERVEPADRIGDLAVEVPQHELGGVDQFDIALSSAVHFGLRYQLGVRGHPDRLVDDVHQRAQAARYPVHRVPLRQHAFAVAGYQQHRLGALGPGEGAGDGRSAGSPRRRYREQPGRHDGRDSAGGRPSRLDLRHRPHHFDGAATDPPAQRLPRPRHVPEPAQNRADLHKYRSRRGTSQPLFRSQHPYAARWWSGCSHFSRGLLAAAGGPSPRSRSVSRWLSASCQGGKACRIGGRGRRCRRWCWTAATVLRYAHRRGRVGRRADECRTPHPARTGPRAGGRGPGTRAARLLPALEEEQAARSAPGGPTCNEGLTARACSRWCRGTTRRSA